MKEFMDKVTAFAQDALTIDVLTMKGNLNIKVDDLRTTPGDENSPIDFQKIFKHLAGSASGEFQVVAYSHVSLDRDTVQFVMDATGDAENALVAHHRETVKDVQDARTAFVDSVKSVLLG